jgi:hypothetical protein
VFFKKMLVQGYFRTSCLTYFISRFQRVFNLPTYVLQSITSSVLVIYVLFFGLRHFELIMAEYTQKYSRDIVNNLNVCSKRS